MKNFYASPVAAKDRIYLTDRAGTTLVFSHAADPKPLARNKLNDSFSASAAIAGDAIFLRGEKFLYCVGKEGKRKKFQKDEQLTLKKIK